MPGHEKIEQLLVGQDQELVLGGLFNLANERFPHRTVLVSPASIYFDHSLERLVGANLTATAVALTCWGDEDGRAHLSLASDLQDAWVLSTPVNPAVAAAADAILGSAGGSGNLPSLLRRHSYNVVNPSFAVHAIQKNARPSRDRTLYDGDGDSVLFSTRTRFN
jgi:hypothetical protein